MISIPLSLSDPPIGDSTRPVAQLADSQSSGCSATLPDCLLRHAPTNRWATVQLATLAEQQTTKPFANLYIQDCLLKANDLNQVFGHLWQQLSDDQYAAFRLVTAENIKQKLKQQYPKPLFILYYSVHFLVRRVLPKLKGFRKISRLLNVPVDVSKAELIGRLIYCGLNPVDLEETGNDTLLVIQRNPLENPSQTKPIPSEGFLFRMHRMGRHGQPIIVHKLRSMHPYAEYAQAYIHRQHGLMDGGKFRDDFRISTGGRVLRKYWIDELPMLYNLLKGDIKLIGVRPLSPHYFSLYPKPVQHIRLNHKPGLLPPFYADLPGSFEEIVQSELRYMTAYEQAPTQTDLRYLKRILTNIFIHKARSN